MKIRRIEALENYDGDTMSIGAMLSSLGARRRAPWARWCDAYDDIQSHLNMDGFDRIGGAVMNMIYAVP